MPTLNEVYAEAAKLSDQEQAELVERLMSTLLPEPPNSIRTREQLEAALIEGMNSPRHEVTPETWREAHSELERRFSNLQR